MCVGECVCVLYVCVYVCRPMYVCMCVCMYECMCAFLTLRLLLLATMKSDTSQNSFIEEAYVCIKRSTLADLETVAG